MENARAESPVFSLGLAPCFGIHFEEDLDTICGPDRDTSSEKVCVLTPKWAGQPERCGQYRPITLVASAQTFTSLVFKRTVKVALNRSVASFKCRQVCRRASVVRS